MRIQACNMLTTNVLQGFRQQCLRFRCSVEMKHRRVQICPGGVQICPGGTSGKGSTARHHKPSHASEPEPKPQIFPQLTEQLSVTQIPQAHLCVQIHRKNEVSLAHSKTFNSNIQGSDSPEMCCMSYSRVLFARQTQADSPDSSRPDSPDPGRPRYGGNRYPVEHT